MSFRTQPFGLWNRLYAGVVAPWLSPDPQAHRGLAKRMAYHRMREGLSLDENRELQWRSLQKLLQHAYETAPFYKRRFDAAGVRPADIRTAADLQAIPPLTREDIRDNLDEMWSRRFRREALRTSVTGGTTSTPVPFLRNLESVQEKVAIQQRFCCWAGLPPGEKVFYLWGAQQDFPENPPLRWRLYSELLLREMYLSTSVMNEERMEARRLALNRFRPRVICGFTTPLELFCEYLRDCGKPFHRPVSAICSAEPLYDHQRALIESVLGCPLFNHYRTREFGMIAADCEHHRLHFNPAAAFTEFLPVPGDEEGLHEVLVTDLYNTGMPLIRYQVNDCAVLADGACECGIGYPFVQKLTGRTSDVFVLANGDCVPGVSLIRLAVGFCKGIEKIQVIQETVDQFRVRYVPGPDFEEPELARLQEKLSQRFAVPVRWTFERVAQIDRERSGKTRYCISHVRRTSAAAASQKVSLQGVTPA